jgi:hypothetical protein
VYNKSNGSLFDPAKSLPNVTSHEGHSERSYLSTPISEKWASIPVTC